MCVTAVSGLTQTYVIHASDFHMPKDLIVCGSDPPANVAVVCPTLNHAVLPRRLMHLPKARRWWVVVLQVSPWRRGRNADHSRQNSNTGHRRRCRSEDVLQNSVGSGQITSWYNLEKGHLYQHL